MNFSLCVLSYWQYLVYVMSYYVIHVVVISQGLCSCTFVSVVNIPYIWYFYFISIMELLRSEEGIPYFSHLLKLSLPSYFFLFYWTFLTALGCIKCLVGAYVFIPRHLRHRSSTTEAACTFHWNIRRRPYSVPNSDIYWISPANLQTHYHLLSILAVGGLGSVLSAIASASAEVVSHFSILQVDLLQGLAVSY
jgi:hypothetical protein